MTSSVFGADTVCHIPAVKLQVFGVSDAKVHLTNSVAALCANECEVRSRAPSSEWIPLAACQPTPNAQHRCLDYPNPKKQSQPRQLAQGTLYRACSSFSACVETTDYKANAPLLNISSHSCQ